MPLLSLSFKFVPAPLGATHDTNATRPTTSTTAPPFPPPTRCTGGPTRAVACEAGYLFRVVVVASSSVVGGAFRTFRNYPECHNHNQPKTRNEPPRLGKI